MICKQCGKSNAEGTAYCSDCGATLTPRATAGGEQAVPGAPGTASAVTPAFQLDVKRWSAADRIAGGATIVLFVSLFLPWFGYAGQSVNGLWHGYEYITLIVALVILAYLVMRAGGVSLPLNPALRHDVLLIAATGINLMLVFIGFLDKPSASTVFFSFTANWEFGAFLGLIAAIVATVAAVSPLLPDRSTRL